MGLFDEIKEKAQDLVGSHKDQANEGVEKVGEFINDHTDGKYEDQVNKGKDAAHGFVDQASGDENK